MTGYEKIKQLKKESGYNIPDLLALAPANDPFYAGSPSAREKAEWFANLWQEFGYSSGVHLRRFHYQLVSQEEPIKHDGKPYKNTDKDWEYLLAASKYARHLGLVDPKAFTDRRNPDPHIFLPDNFYQEEIAGWTYNFLNWCLPLIAIELADDLDWELPFLSSVGYDYNENMQPYHMEIWAEKSTMDDVLIPLCRRYSVNLVTGIGFLSITSVISLLERISRYKKPCRIFYVSDFDPAGAVMPTAVGRQIEYYLEGQAAGANVKLNPIVLTKEQVTQYRLPRIPIKETDKRKNGFEERFGEGAVELDALEALHPNKLARIIKENIEQFRDGKLNKKIYEAREEAEEELKSWWEARIEPYQEDLDNLKAKVEAITSIFQEQIDELKTKLEAELEPLKDDINSLRQAIQLEIDNMYPELPKLPEPETEPNDDGWLFDSNRNYSEQLDVYKKKRNGNYED